MSHFSVKPFEGDDTQLALLASLESLPSGTGQFILKTNSTTLGLGSGGGSQTPWTSDIDGGGFSLSNVDDITADSFITNGGLSTDFVKGDGSLDSNTYITSAGAPVQSVFGRTGAVLAQSGDYDTSLVPENINLYFTDARAISALTGQNISIFNNDSGYITSAGAPIQDVSNSDGSLTISPTTGNVVASLNVGNTNTWTAAQTFQASTILGAASVQNGTLLFKGTTSGTVTMTTANAAGTWTMILPTSAGTSGFVLQTNGSGVTSWVTKTPTLTSQQVGFGSGTNLLIGSTKFLWNDSNAGTLTFSGNGTGSPVTIQSGAVGGVPANIQFAAAAAGSGTDLDGGSLFFAAGTGDGIGNGGDVNFVAGSGVLSGLVNFTDGNSGLKAGVNMSLLDGDRTFQFPNLDGRFTVGIKDTDLTGQVAAIAATTLFTPTKIGMYRITVYLQVTRAATVSSILGGATGVVITYRDGDGNVVQTDTVGLTAPNGTVVTTLNTNTTATNLTGSVEIYCKATSVTYAIGYTSVGATAMAYAAHIRVEAL